jgi:beta-glucosidase/6-phospho-beta-glucosidase/beta-galactosidase
MQSTFMFATGIENSYPTIQLPDGTIKRVDEMEKTGHYKNWETDFGLVREMGISFLRYGPPYYSTHTGPGKYDWSFADMTFNKLKEMGITPIADLCHFGVPDWMGNFQNPDFPVYFYEYAKAFAIRFPEVKYYTPVNEIFIAATFSAQYGWWNERLSSDKDFVTALKHLSKANVLAMQAILGQRSDAVFIQSESSEYYHPVNPDAQKIANFLNQKRFLSLDLAYGYQVAVPVYEYLMDNGMTRAEYHWFSDNQVAARCIMGNDYYVTNEHLVHPDGKTQASGEIFGYYVITNQYYKRYRMGKCAQAHAGRRTSYGFYVV